MIPRIPVPVVAAVLALLAGCSRQTPVTSPPDPAVAPAQTRPSRATVPKVAFTDVTAAAGLRFRHVNAAFGKKLLPETLGSGCAFIDYDGDGRQDLLLVNSCWWPGWEDKKEPAPTMALYRNKGDGSFEDVTAAAGLDLSFYGMGAAVADYDNDGHPDLVITALGGSHLFRNVDGPAGRRFIDVSRESGLARDWNWPSARGEQFLGVSELMPFPSSAAFVDYDKDGLLDLFVCHYVQWSPHADLAQGFTLLGKGRAYGPPRYFEGTQCRLYRNQGGGRFADVTGEAGLEVFGEFARPVGKALGVIACDVDEDGWPDIVVANDTVRNFFFHNLKNGKFKEIGQEAGVAYAEGSARGAMGVDWAEFRTGQQGLMIGNFANEPNTFLRLDDRKQLLFSDVALIEGVSGPSRPGLTFGLFFFDYDLDGRLDFLSANGHLEPEIQRVQPSQSYRQPVQLYWNTGTRPGYELVTAAECGSDLLRPLVGRGCAYADIDGNGTLDVVLTENGGAARLLRNDGGTKHHWVRLVLEGDGQRCNRSAIGARVMVHAGGTMQKRAVCASKGYLSCSELPLTFGLGSATHVDRVEIHWPARDLPPQVLSDLAVDREHIVRLGEGIGGCP